MDQTELKFDQKVEIHVNKIHPCGPCDYRVLVLSFESRPFREPNARVIEYAKFYNLILTTDPELLEKCSNARLFLFGCSWLSQDDIHLVKDKKFGVSFVCGNKKVTQGHQLRQHLWLKQKEITCPKMFWISEAGPIPSIDNNPVLPRCGQQKIKLFEQEFHIAIENVKIDNYFTEKLMDCFVAKTVPIYYGCPNIGNWFNVNGIIVVNNVNAIVDACNSLDYKEYEKRKDAIEENAILCKQFCEPLHHRLKKEISKYIGVL